jgi:hypothetical protein
MQNVSSWSPGQTPAQTHQRLVREPERLAERTEVLLDQAPAEPVVTGGHGRVRCEDGHRRHPAQRLLKPDPLGHHLRADHLQRGESAVAFVEMEHPRDDAERLQGPQAADAQEQLLADSHAGVAAVKPRGELAVLGGVRLDVGIEQQQRVPADRHLPDACRDRRASGLDPHGDRPVVRPDQELEGKLPRVDVEIVFMLPARLVEPLPEVALGIEEPDAHERHPEVGCALHMVARQDAKTSGVDRQALVETELGREVRDRPRL